SLPGVRKLYLGPQRHLPQVRHLRRDQRMQLTGAKALVRSATRDATESCGGVAARELRKADSEADFLAHIILRRSAKHLPIFAVRLLNRSSTSLSTQSPGLVTHIAEIVVKNLTT